MYTRLSKINIGFILVALLFASVNQARAEEERRISGPYQVRNLAIYLVHGANKDNSTNYITLGEAMKSGKVKVHETGTVNTLKIENLSANDQIYIQAGEIVKGGKQDRVFSTDLILQPKSGQVDISAFCVEQGRWAKRGNESLQNFSGSSKALASKDLRMAAQLKQDQNEVWKNVSVLEKKMSDKVGGSVKNKSSESSLQLVLENQKLTTNIKDYIAGINQQVANQKEVVGFAFAINGKLNSADVYSNDTLFRKLWPKMLEAAATEALSEYNKGVKVAAPEKTEINKWFGASAKLKARAKLVSKETRIDTSEDKENVQFRTYSGKGADAKTVHENYMKK